MRWSLVFFSSRRRHTRSLRDWSSDVCSSDLEPPLKLVLLEGGQGQPTVMDHLGVEVESTGQVTAATSRLADAGLATEVEEDTTCCYAVQDKVWVHGPGSEPWEVYVVKADADVLAKGPDSACCTPAGQATDADGGKEPASACC